MTDQMAFDLDLPELRPRDVRPPCVVCEAPALANVYGFTWYQPRRSFISGPRAVACRAHLDEVTVTTRAEALEMRSGLLLVWSLIHQPGDLDATLPGTDFAWHEIERIDP